MTERLRVRAARDGRDLKRFIDLPYRLHARDPLWVPPLRRDVATLLSHSKNPFFEQMLREDLDAMRIDAATTLLDIGCATGVAA